MFHSNSSSIRWYTTLSCDTIDLYWRVLFSGTAFLLDCYSMKLWDFIPHTHYNTWMLQLPKYCLASKHFSSNISPSNWLCSHWEKRKFWWYLSVHAVWHLDNAHGSKGQRPGSRSKVKEYHSQNRWWTMCQVWSKARRSYQVNGVGVENVFHFLSIFARGLILFNPLSEYTHSLARIWACKVSCSREDT